MNLAPVIARIAGICLAMRSVGGAAEFDSIQGAGTATAPACYIIPLAEQADDGYLAGLEITAQEVDVSFGVVICARNAKDVRGEAALADIETLRASVRQAIHGWQPATDAGPCLIQGGQLMSFEPGVIWWLDTYRTRYDVRTTQA